MLAVQAQVDAAARLIAHIRRWSERPETGDRRQIGLYDIHALLIGPFVIDKEVRLVLLDRAAEHESTLTAGKLRIVGQRIAGKTRIGSDVLIAMIKVARAM